MQDMYRKSKSIISTDSFLDIIRHPAERDVAVFPNRIGCPRISILRQADTAGIDNERFHQACFHRDMRVAEKKKIRKPGS